jgi:hypothetical protein
MVVLSEMYLVGHLVVLMVGKTGPHLVEKKVGNSAAWKVNQTVGSKVER